MKSVRPAIFAFSALFLGAAQPAARASHMIGVSFNNAAGNALADTDIAGVVPQDHWKNWVSATAPASSLNDETGAATTATLTLPSGLAFAFLAAAAAGGDEKLNNGFLQSKTASVLTWSFTLHDIPYAQYELIAYVIDADTLRKSITAGGTTYYINSPVASGSTYIDNDGGTAFHYVLGTSTIPGSPTNPANYVRFSGLTLADLTVTIENISDHDITKMSGFQIIEVESAVPEPGTYTLLLMGGAMLAASRRRRSGGAAA